MNTEIVLINARNQINIEHNSTVKAFLYYTLNRVEKHSVYLLHKTPANELTRWNLLPPVWLWTTISSHKGSLINT